MEHYGAVKLNEKARLVEDKTAVKIIENTTCCVDGQYEVGMLWKGKERQFLNNVAMAKHRLAVGSPASCQKKSQLNK